jgi:hypothetical protein
VLLGLRKNQKQAAIIIARNSNGSFPEHPNPSKALIIFLPFTAYTCILGIGGTGNDELN